MCDIPAAKASYLGAELDEHHVLVGGGVSDDLHVLDHLVEGGHELHEVVAGHGGGDSEDAEHGTAPHILLQGRHLAGDTAGTQLHLTSPWAGHSWMHSWTHSSSHRGTATLL